MQANVILITRHGCNTNTSVTAMFGSVSDRLDLGGRSPLNGYNSRMSITAPMPMLALPAQRSPVETDARRRRREALRSVGAVGDRYVWPHFTLVVTLGGLWIAQDDYFPANGEEDPIPAEWRDVLRFARSFGCRDVGEPWYDTQLSVYVWIVLS